MSQLHIRPATEQDIDLILHFVRELAIYEKAEHEVKATPEHVRRTLFCANPSVFGLICEIEGKAVGFAMVDAEEGCVFAAFVLPEWEGRGLGRRLMAEAEASLFRRHETIWLETDGRSRASGFYAHLGWKPTATDGNGDVRFEKKRPRPALSLSGPGEKPF
mgnify:CR=1 FL=1